MASKIKEGSHGKVMKSNLFSLQANVLRERQSTVDNSVNGKPLPHYLKPTLSSSGAEVCKYGRKHASESPTGKNLVRRLSLEKPVPKSQPHKGPASASPKDKQLKYSTSLPRTVITSKAVNEKDTRTSRIIRPCVLIKKETVAVMEKPPTILNELKKEELVEKQLVEKVFPEEEKEQEFNEMVLNQEQTETKIVELGSDIGEQEKIEDYESLTSLEGLEEKNQTAFDNINNEKWSEPEEAINETDEKNEGEEKDQKMKQEDGGEEDKAHKLKFRQGTYINVDEEACDELQQVKLNKMDAAKGRDTEDTRPEAENVVLKKQEVQGKKESVDYNGVIEETASKLAEQRKNKVLALAGAFETVISLHESEGLLPPNKKD